MLAFPRFRRAETRRSYRPAVIARDAAQLTMRGQPGSRRLLAGHGGRTVFHTAAGRPVTMGHPATAGEELMLFARGLGPQVPSAAGGSGRNPVRQRLVGEFGSRAVRRAVNATRVSNLNCRLPASDCSLEVGAWELRRETDRPFGRGCWLRPPPTLLPETDLGRRAVLDSRVPRRDHPRLGPPGGASSRYGSAGFDRIAETNGATGLLARTAACFRAAVPGSKPSPPPAPPHGRQPACGAADSSQAAHT